MYRTAEIGCGAHGLLSALHPRMDPVAFCNIVDKTQNDAVKIARVVKEKMAKDKEATPVQGYYDYRDMIEKESPDIVFISTPNPLHAEMSIFALDHGCHVLVEKPMCVTLEECEQMVDAVKRSGRKLAVNQCARTIKSFQTVYDRLYAGELGTPSYIRSEYLHGSLRHRIENPDDLSARTSVLLLGGSHPIDLILGLMREQPQTVFGSGAKLMSDERFLHNDLMTVLMHFPSNRTAFSLTTLSCHRRGLGMAFEMYGTDCDVIQTMTYDQNADTAGLRFCTPQGAENVCRFGATQQEIDLAHGQGFYRQEENLLYAIEHDVKQITMADVVDGARTVSVALAAEASAQSGKAEQVRRWSALQYNGDAPGWRLDDYQSDMLREYVPLLSQEGREQILGRKTGVKRFTTAGH